MPSPLPSTLAVEMLPDRFQKAPYSGSIYSILGLQENPQPSRQQMLKAYQKAMLMYHPDKHAGVSEKESAELSSCTQALTNIRDYLKNELKSENPEEPGEEKQEQEEQRPVNRGPYVNLSKKSIVTDVYEASTKGAYLIRGTVGSDESVELKLYEDGSVSSLDEEPVEPGQLSPNEMLIYQDRQQIFNHFNLKLFKLLPGHSEIARLVKDKKVYVISESDESKEELYVEKISLENGCTIISGRNCDHTPISIYLHLNGEVAKDYYGNTSLGVEHKRLYRDREKIFAFFNKEIPSNHTRCVEEYKLRMAQDQQRQWNEAQEQEQKRQWQQEQARLAVQEQEQEQKRQWQQEQARLAAQEQEQEQKRQWQQEQARLAAQEQEQEQKRQWQQEQARLAAQEQEQKRQWQQEQARLAAQEQEQKRQWQQEQARLVAQEQRRWEQQQLQDRVIPKYESMNGKITEICKEVNAALPLLHEEKIYVLTLCQNLALFIERCISSIRLNPVPQTESDKDIEIGQWLQNMYADAKNIINTPTLRVFIIYEYINRVFNSMERGMPFNDFVHAGIHIYNILHHPDRSFTIQGRDELNSNNVIEVRLYQDGRVLGRNNNEELERIEDIVFKAREKIFLHFDLILHTVLPNHTPQVQERLRQEQVKKQAIADYTTKIAKLHQIEGDVSHDQSLSIEEKAFMNAFCTELTTQMTQDITKMEQLVSVPNALEESKAKIAEQLNRAVHASKNIPRTSGIRGYLNKFFACFGWTPFVITNSKTINTLSNIGFFNNNINVGEEERSAADDESFYDEFGMG